MYVALIPYIPDQQKLLYSSDLNINRVNKYHWLHVYSQLENIQTSKTSIKNFYYYEKEEF